MTTPEAEQPAAADSAPSVEVALPRQEPSAEVAVPPAPQRARDVARDLQEASSALRFLAAANSRADVSATLQMVIVCAGVTPADTLEACAAFVRQSPRVEIHAIAWARIPGPVAGTEEFQATLTVSYPDRNGEFSGTTDHAPAKG
jgi:hypothetical protein